MRITWLLLLLGLCLHAHSQRYNNWFFGANAGVSFNAHLNPAVPFNLGAGATNTFEATCGISDENGNLLFYTDGVTVYNRDHNKMLQGDNIGGDLSSFQGAVILKQPGNDNIYYIFTGDAIENNFQKSYRYSIVDMSGDNGRGIVKEKNKLLHAPGTERLTAVRHANSIDAWVITNDNNSNTFRAWLLTCNGLQTTPVVSSVGEILNRDMFMNMGTIKSSPDGKKLCQTFFPDVNFNFFQLFDFDNRTGVLSNPKKVICPDGYFFASEFSPNSKFIYLTNAYGKEIYQADVSFSSAPQIEASLVKIPSDAKNYGIQLGPDGRIYVNNSSEYLGVINFPDLKGTACNYREKQVHIVQNGQLSLPFVMNEINPDPNYFDFKASGGCTGTIDFSGFTGITGSVQWEWDFGDGTKSNQKNPSHTFVPANKIYLVTLKIRSPSMCGYILRSKYVAPSGMWVKANFDYSVVCDSNLVRFSNTSFFSDSVSFTWSFGDGTSSNEQHPVHRYTASGTYPVRLVVSSGIPCSNDSVEKTINLELVSLQASSDQFILEGQSVRLNANGSGVSYQWSPVTGLNNPNIPDPVATPFDNTTYVVTATNESGCINSDSVKITVQKLKDIYVPTAFTPNRDGLNDVLKPFIGGTLQLDEFSIYNRWGQKVFSTKERGRGWDGRIADEALRSDVFIWLLKVREASGRIVVRKGTTMLIR